MPLHDLVSLRETDSASTFGALGGVVQFKDFLLRFGRNAGALIKHLGNNRFILAARLHRECSSRGHRLHAIDNEIQDRLLDQIGVDSHHECVLFVRQVFFKQIMFNQVMTWQFEHDAHTVARGVGGGERRYALQNLAQVDILEAKVARTREVNQNLNDAVEATDFAADDVHVTASIGVVLLEFILQQLQVQHDGIDRVLYFVGHASGEPSTGGKAARNFYLIFSPAHGLGIAHG